MSIFGVGLSSSLYHDILCNTATHFARVDLTWQKYNAKSQVSGTPELHMLMLALQIGHVYEGQHEPVSTPGPTTRQAVLGGENAGETCTERQAE